MNQTKQETINFLKNADSEIKQKSKSIFRTGLAQIKVVPKGFYISFYDPKTGKEIGVLVEQFEVY